MPFVIELGDKFFRQFTWCDREPVFTDDASKAYHFEKETDAIIVAQDCIDTFKLQVAVVEKK